MKIDSCLAIKHGRIRFFLDEQWINMDDHDDFVVATFTRGYGLGPSSGGRGAFLGQLRKTYDGCIVERNALFLAFAAVGPS